MYVLLMFNFYKTKLDSQYRCWCPAYGALTAAAGQCCPCRVGGQTNQRMPSVLHRPTNQAPSDYMPAEKENKVVYML